MFKIGERARVHDTTGFPSERERPIQIGLGDRPVRTGNDPMPRPPHVERLDRLAGHVGRRRPGVEPGTGEIEMLAALIAVMTSLSERLDRLERLHADSATERV